MLDRLAELGVDRVTDVLVTHHHRDQVQGLRAPPRPGSGSGCRRSSASSSSASTSTGSSGSSTTTTTSARTASRCSSPCRSRAVVAEYRTRRYRRPSTIFTLPTPGHTIGSVTYLVERRRVGDSPSAATSSTAPGKVWSLAATQWSYTGMEGLRCHARLLRRARRPRAGRAAAVARRADREPAGGARARCAPACRSSSTCALEQPWDLADLHASPWTPVTAHLLRNRASLRQQLRAALRDGRGAADRLRLRPHDGPRPEHRPRGAAAARSGRSPRSAATTASTRIEAVGRRPTTTTTTSPASSCCARSRARRSGRRRTWRRSWPTRCATTCRASGSSRSRSTGCSPSASRSRWHEYELTAPRAARPHALRGRDRARGRRQARARDRRPADRAASGPSRSTTSTGTASGSTTSSRAPSSTARSGPT